MKDLEEILILKNILPSVKHDNHSIEFIAITMELAYML